MGDCKLGERKVNHPLALILPQQEWALPAVFHHRVSKLPPMDLLLWQVSEAEEWVGLLMGSSHDHDS